MAWELEKQTLLGNWTNEHADIKRGMAADGEVLTRLMVAQQARTAIILAAKTEIDLLAEAQRLILAQLPADVSPYEVALASQKVLTAGKRLLVIPILQSIVQAENDLIVEKNALIAAKRGVLPEEQALLSEMRRVAGKKQVLAPILGEITAKLVLLSAALTKQGADLSLIAAAKVAQAGYRVAIATSGLARATTLSEIDGVENEIYILKLEMETLRDRGTTDALRQEGLDIKATTAKEKEVRDFVEASDRTANQNVIDKKTSGMNDAKASKISNAEEVKVDDGMTVGWNASYRRQTNDEVADIQMKESVITASLQHLLGM